MKENPLKYIISDIITKMEQNNSLNAEREDKIFDSLIKACINKEKLYKQKYSQNKMKSLYGSLDNKNISVKLS